MAWRCPDCGRSFGRRGQWHSCRPAVALEDWLSTRPPQVRDILVAVRAHVETLGGDVLLEPTRDAVMIKRARTFAEVKPRRGRTEVALVLPRRLPDRRVVRTLDLTRDRIVHVVDVADAADVDEQLRAWLTEAYGSSPA